MTLDEFFKRADAPTMSAFAATLTDLALREQPDAKPTHEGQVRQWRHRYVASGGSTPREPSPASCVLIEEATGGLVTRPELRPGDWMRIWPELKALAPTKGGKPKRERAAAGELCREIDRIVYGTTRPPGDKPNNSRRERG